MKTYVFALISLLLISSPLYAGLICDSKPQKNCSVGGDVRLDKNSATAYSKCMWSVSDDSKMEISLYVCKEIDFIVANCKFSPGAPDSKDTIKSISVTKSGNANGSSSAKSLDKNNQIIDSNNIKFILRNYNNSFEDKDKNTSRMDVIFHLNNSRFTAGNQINCTFAPVQTPALS